MPNSNESIKKQDYGISRRNFFKGAGLVAAASAMAQLPITGNNIAEAATANSIDELYEISKDYKQFNQKNEMFARMEWDTKFIPPPKPTITPGSPGYTVLDIAAGGAAGTVANTLGTGFGWRSGNEGLYSWSSLGAAKPPQEPWKADPAEASKAIKRFAHDNRIDAVGITTVDPRWVYTDWFHRGTKESGKIELSSTADKPEIKEDGTKVIPTKMKYVIVLLHRMPFEMVSTSPYVLGHAGTQVGYSLMAYGASTIAEFIRGLGYNAIPAGNDTMLSIPLAIQAGLGELGRNGLLMSTIGPNVRISKVITDLPLATDKPVNLGVRDFCESCKKCARECPSGAISEGDMTTEGFNISNNDGIKKWYVDCEKCRVFWNENGGAGCIRCIATCPYNKPEGYWTHELGNKLAPILGGGLVTVDDWMGYGKIVESEDYWKNQ